MRRRERLSGVIGFLVSMLVGLSWLASGLVREGLGWTGAFGLPLLLVAGGYLMLATTGIGLLERLTARRRR